MSALVMGLVWEQAITPDFGRAEKYVLLAYADHADQNGKNIFPSVDLISKKTGYEERSVQVITRNLEQLGMLIDDGQGPHGTNRYSIPIVRLPDGGAKIAPQPMQETAPLPDAKTAPEGTAPEETAPEGTAPEPSLVEVNDLTTTTTTTTGGEIFKIYETEIGVLTPLIADAIQYAEKTYPAEWLPAAIHEAALNNKRNWKYCEAILKRWKVEGFQATRMRQTTDVPSPKVKKPVPAMSSSNADAIRKVARNVRF
jgi:DnaD/phage-associated family protein